MQADGQCDTNHAVDTEVLLQALLELHAIAFYMSSKAFHVSLELYVTTWYPEDWKIARDMMRYAGQEG